MVVHFLTVREISIEFNHISQFLFQILNSKFKTIQLQNTIVNCQTITSTSTH